MNKVETVVIGPPGPLPPDLEPGVVVDGVNTSRASGIVDAVEVDRTAIYFVLACVLLLAAAGLAVAGVYVLFGAGWSMLVGAAACAGAGTIVFRGLSNA